MDSKAERNLVLEVIGFLISELVAYGVWRLLPMIPDWLYGAVVAGLALVWVLIYFLWRPKGVSKEPIAKAGDFRVRLQSTTIGAYGIDFKKWKRTTLVGVKANQQHLEIKLLFPMHSWIATPIRQVLGQRIGYPSRALIVNNLTKNAYHAPPDYWILIQDQVINYDTYVLGLPPHRLKKWAAGNGYKYCNRRPTDEELLEGTQPVGR